MNIFQDASNYGDVTLCGHSQGLGEFSFLTYNYKHAAGGTLYEIRTIQYKQIEFENWFFVYFGYSYEKK